MAAPAAVLSVLVSANTSSATRGLMRFNTQLGATEAKSNKALGALKTLGKGAAIGAGVGLGFAVKKAADFESQLDSLGSVSGATGRQMEQFRKQAMKAGADTKYSALEAAKAQTELAKGGLSVRNIMRGGLKSALALAAAGEMDLAEAAATTANAMNLFGLEGKASMKVADALATAANATTADVTDFAMALRQGGAVAKSAGLSFEETVVALEALAASGIKNSDAGTSLKTAMIQLIKPTAKQAKLADKLNLSFLDSRGNFKGLADVSIMLRDRLGGMTKAQRTATLATLAGTDGVRTLTALYDAGPDKINKWSVGVSKSGTAAQVAAQKQDNLKGKLENLQGSIETIAISVGSKLIPVLSKAAENITKVLNDPNLTTSEKLDKFGQMFATAIGDAAPLVAQAAGKVALIAVRGFFNAFRESPLWLKLITAGFILKKLGGFSAFRTAGTQAGGQMAEGMATSGKWAGLRGQMRGIGKAVIGGALIAGAADAITREGIKGIGDRWQQFASTASFGLIPGPRDIDQRLQTISSRIKAWRNSGQLALNRPGDPSNSLIRKKDLDDFDANSKQMLTKLANLRNIANRVIGPGSRLNTGAWANPGPAIRDFKAIEVGMNRLRNRLAGDSQGIQQVSSRNLRLMARNMSLHSREGQQAVSQNMRLTLTAIQDRLGAGEISAKSALRGIRNAFKIHTGASKETAARNFAAARGSIQGAMAAGTISARDGLREIQRLFKQYLGAFGIKGRDAEVYLQGGDNKGGNPANRPLKFQRGGVLIGGKPSGDSIPAMLERGEYVLNRKAVQAIGARQLDAVNFGAAPRFAKGGQIPRQKVGGPGFGGLQPSVQKGLDMNVRAANALLREAKAKKAQEATGPKGKPTGVKGVVSYPGLQFGIAKWVLGALNHARRKGFSGQPTSGYRPHWWNVSQGRNYRSEHEGTQYPHGAIDFGGFTTGLATKMAFVQATADYKHPLLAPIGFRDDGHASGTGHQRGGLIARMQRGGRAGPGGIPGRDWKLAQKWGRRYNVDPLLLVAIGKHETDWGRLGDGRRGNILGVGSFDTGSSYKWAGVENQLKMGASLLDKWGARRIKDVMAGKAGSWATDPRWEGAVKSQWSKIATPNWRKRRNRWGTNKKGMVWNPRKGKFVGAAQKKTGGGKGKKGPKAVKGRTKLTLNDQIAYVQQAVAAADATLGKADDLQTRKLLSPLLAQKRGRIRGKIAAINKRLKGKLKPSTRRALIDRRSSLIGDLGSVQSELQQTGSEMLGLIRPEPTDTTPDTSLADAIRAQTEVSEQLRAELKRQNDYAEAVSATVGAQSVKALTDLLNGQMGGYYSTRRQSPGAGVGARF